jgi:hypothetical protein
MTLTRAHTNGAYLMFGSLALSAIVALGGCRGSSGSSAAPSKSSQSATAAALTAVDRAVVDNLVRLAWNDPKSREAFDSYLADGTLASNLGITGAAKIAEANRYGEQLAYPAAHPSRT